MHYCAVALKIVHCTVSYISLKYNAAAKRQRSRIEGKVGYMVRTKIFRKRKKRNREKGLTPAVSDRLFDLKLLFQWVGLLLINSLSVCLSVCLSFSPFALVCVLLLCVGFNPFEVTSFEVTGSCILVLKLTFSPDTFPRNLPLSLTDWFHGFYPARVRKSLALKILVSAAD